MSWAPECLGNLNFVGEYEFDNGYAWRNAKKLEKRKKLIRKNMWEPITEWSYIVKYLWKLERHTSMKTELHVSRQ